MTGRTATALGLLLSAATTAADGQDQPLTFEGRVEPALESASVEGRTARALRDSGLLHVEPRGGTTDFHDYPPDGRYGHTAVWTGTEMIVWGGAYSDTGGRYDPSTDTWTPVSRLNAPSARGYHVAAWTGSLMIVWGGYGASGTTASGGRYDPATDSWQPTSQVSAPTPRLDATAVWSGTEMIVWGGRDGGALDSGGRYDPATNTWLPTPSAGAPWPRFEHTAVWTGSEMIVSGGYDGATYFRTGGRLNPATGTWTPTSVGATLPLFRRSHTAVWTGTEMILWGGRGPARMQNGERYDPVSDTWTTTAIDASTPSRREYHTAVWTGSRMLVWGGFATATQRLGGTYDPATDTWQPITTTAAPSARQGHTAVWTGSEMIVWGGGAGSSGGATWSGGRYDLASDTWAPTTTSNGAFIPSPRSYHAAVWTGREMVAWGGWSGGRTGGRYYPSTDTWLPTSTGSGTPPGMSYPAAVWTGSRMVVWGSGGGSRYDPTSDTWVAVSSTNEPERRYWHTAVWTGTEMVVWGGTSRTSSTELDTGGRYDPVADVWRATSLVAAPSRRRFHASVWTGTEMIVWGGNQVSQFFDDGGRYDPSSDTWSPVDRTTAPPPRASHTMVWTGAGAIVWGGRDSSSRFSDGARYDPSSNTWTPVSAAGAPRCSFGHTATWTGSAMIVWGGTDASSGLLDEGASYDPTADAWRPVARLLAPPPRQAHTAVWTGATMLVWGGRSDGDLASGGSYDPVLDRWEGATTTFTDIVTGPGPDPSAPPLVLAFDTRGRPGTTSIMAYGVSAFGANVGAGNIAGMSTNEILTGPGPGAVFGPQVRGWRVDSTPITKVNFYAYATLRHGVASVGARLDADGFAEILATPGPGAVFGPHVRGFDYDGLLLAPLPGASFYAYGTLKYGVNGGRGEIASGSSREILTAPGPGPAFGPQVRAFRYGPPVLALAKVSFYAFGAPWKAGGRVDGSDVDADGWDEILVSRGPDAAFTTAVAGFDYDDATVSPVPGLAFEPYPGAAYGVEPHGGDLDGDTVGEILVSRGADPGGDARIAGFDYTGSVTPLPALDFVAYGTTYGAHAATGNLGF